MWDQCNPLTTQRRDKQIKDWKDKGNIFEEKIIVCVEKVGKRLLQLQIGKQK